MSHPDRPPPGERSRTDMPQPPVPTAWHPSPTAHAVLAAAAAGLIVLFALDAGAPSPPSADGGPQRLLNGMILAGFLLALVATRTATAVAFRPTRRRGSPTDTEAFALSQRIGFNSAAAFGAGLVGPSSLVTARAPAPLIAALIAVVAAAFLLDIRDATRLAATRPGANSTTAPPTGPTTAPTGGVRLLPPGSHRFLRRGHRVNLTLLSLVTATSTGLVAATAATELGRAPARPLTGILQVLAAAAVAITGVVLVRTLHRRGRGLLVGPDAIRLDMLAEATTGLRRFIVPAAVAAVLTVAAVLADPAAPLLAAGRALPLLLILLPAVLNAIALTPQYLGEIRNRRHPGPPGHPHR